MNNSSKLWIDNGGYNAKHKTIIGKIPIVQEYNGDVKDEKKPLEILSELNNDLEIHRYY